VSAAEIDSGTGIDCERAQAEQPATTHLMIIVGWCGADGRGMAGLVLHVMGLGRAMVHRVGMGETLSRVFPMAEGEHGGGRHEAKRRERR